MSSGLAPAEVRAHGHHVRRHRNAVARHVDDGAVVATPDSPLSERVMREEAVDDLKFSASHFFYLRKKARFQEKEPLPPKGTARLWESVRD